MAKKEKINNKLVTPPVTLAFSFLNKPDTKGKYADGKYKTTLVYDDTEEVTEFIKTFKRMGLALAKQKWPKLKSGKRLKFTFQDGDEKLDPETGEPKEEFEGKTLQTVRTKYKPGFVGANRKPLPGNIFPASGDLVKAQLEVFVYGESLAKAGVSAYVKNVMLLEKRSGGADEDASDVDWGETDEYEGISGFDSDDEPEDEEDGFDEGDDDFGDDEDDEDDGAGF